MCLDTTFFVRIWFLHTQTSVFIWACGWVVETPRLNTKVDASVSLSLFLTTTNTWVCCTVGLTVHVWLPSSLKTIYINMSFQIHSAWICAYLTKNITDSPWYFVFLSSDKSDTMMLNIVMGICMGIRHPKVYLSIATVFGITIFMSNKKLSILLLQRSAVNWLSLPKALRNLVKWSRTLSYEGFWMRNRSARGLEVSLSHIEI